MIEQLKAMEEIAKNNLVSLAHCQEQEIENIKQRQQLERQKKEDEEKEQLKVLVNQIEETMKRQQEQKVKADKEKEVQK